MMMYRAGPAAPITAPVTMLGVRLGGLFDGIVLHQILQWHHMLTARGDFPATTVSGLEVNTLWDGLFHAVTYVFIVVGLFWLWDRARAAGVRWSWKRVLGWMLVGWGLFNLAEGVIDHHILQIHHVRAGPNELAWDIAFLALGAASHGRVEPGPLGRALVGPSFESSRWPSLPLAGDPVLWLRRVLHHSSSAQLFHRHHPARLVSFDDRTRNRLESVRSFAVAGSAPGQLDQWGTHMTDTSTKVQQTTDAAKEAAAGDDVMDLTEGREDIPTPMRAVKNLGITSGMAYTAGVASIFLSLAMWFFRRGGHRDTAERLAIFVGLWPPTFMAIGKALEGYEHPGR